MVPKTTESEIVSSVAGFIVPNEADDKRERAGRGTGKRRLGKVRRTFRPLFTQPALVRNDEPQGWERE